ncbi:MAG TPA: hypothetical protein VLI71_09845 [Gammaproteobacteria bacterium]|nr:hypothetical protein [Gammaproteobacteria bacterium]
MNERKPYAAPAIEDITLEQIANALLEVKRLRTRVEELLEANNRAVERRRLCEAAVTEALRLAELYGGWNPEDLAALRAVINACPVCHAQAGEPCRTENVRAALPIPHAERVQEKPDAAGA